jgi:hypothetical protein
VTLTQAHAALARAVRRLGDTPTPAQWQRVHRRFDALHRRLRKAGVGWLDLEPLLLLRPRPEARLPD